MTDTTTNSRSADAESIGSAARLSRTLFLFAALFAAVWMILLLVLSITSANPVTLNRDQVLASVDVLTVVVKDSRVGSVQVEQSWKSEITENELTISDLASSGAVSGERFLIPLIRSRREWLVMPSKLPNGARLIYPATAEAERQLKSILKTGHLP